MADLEMPDVNISAMLPYGTALRPLLTSSCLSDGDINNVLRARGVFVGDPDKQTIIPLMLTMVLCPAEFEMLQERQATREDNPKHRNSTVKAKSKSQLFPVLKDFKVDIDKIHRQNPSIKLDTPMTLGAIDANTMQVQYTIIRHDLTKDWVQPDSKHTGKVFISKDPKSNVIKLCNEYTSKETDDINKQVIKELVAYLESKKEIDDKLETINADDFDNRGRFNFMLQLAKDSHDGSLTFEEIRDVEIGPDPENPPKNPNSIIQENVKKLIINGTALEGNIALTSDDDKENLILRSLEVSYSFNFKGIIGKCILQYGFMHFFRNQNTSQEFQVALQYLKFKGNGNKTAISNFILEQFDILKEQEYSKYTAI